MRLYAGSTQQLVNDTTYNRVADKLSAAFAERYGRSVSHSEYASWLNSLQHVKNLITENTLIDNMVVLEYELPYCSQRIDCTLFGMSQEQVPNVAILELKQWTEAEASDVEGNVVTFVGGSQRMVAHPSAQALGYRDYLQDFVVAFRDEPPLGLSASVYCHNYASREGQGLYAPCYHDLLRECSVFSKEQFADAGAWLRERVGNGQGEVAYDRFMQSPITPSKHLLDLVSGMIEGQRSFVLLDEQIAANNAIVDRIKKATGTDRKTVVLVRGGPGTGKSVIALNAVGELAQMGKYVVHATGSKSFTTAVRKIAGRRGSRLFLFFNSFLPAQVGAGQIDGLICDEAHRLRESSNSRFTKRANQSNMQQIDELLRAARVAAFFIDDAQVVRGGEIGSSELIRERAAAWKADLYEFELASQFRCGGSDDYLAWVDDVLETSSASKGLKLQAADRMHFEVVSSPLQLKQFVDQKNRERPNSARLVAGFCWPWSDPLPDGTLPADVAIGEFAMPWEARDKGRLAPGIPRWYEWASHPGGVGQVGCIYTAQGFEFEHVGVIFGPDLVYDWGSRQWVGHKEASRDPYLGKSRGDFTQFVKNIYRVLLTRGMKSCQVYFVDKETERHFRSRMA